MDTKPTIIEIGILNYPKAQLAAIHGLSDLFLSANKIKKPSPKEKAPIFSVSHWIVSTETNRVEPTFFFRGEEHQEVTCAYYSAELRRARGCKFNTT